MINERDVLNMAGPPISAKRYGIEIDKIKEYERKEQLKEETEINMIIKQNELLTEQIQQQKISIKHQKEEIEQTRKTNKKMFITTIISATAATLSVLLMIIFKFV